MAYHRKHPAAARLNADILVVPECAKLEILQAEGVTCTWDSALWAGDNPRKGLAVFARAPYRIEPICEPTEDLPIWVIPSRILTPKGVRLDLLSVWSFYSIDKRNKTGNPVVAALEQFADRLTSNDLFVAGDFNSSVIWDRGKLSDHKAISKALAERGSVSAYHTQRGVTYSEELEPTIFWRDRTVDGPHFHIDYIYVPKRFIGEGLSVEIGSHADWVAPGLSDHVPLVVDIAGIK